jgi:hypothetical protein
VGQPIGAGLQLRIAQGATVEEQRRQLGSTCDLSLEQFGKRRRRYVAVGAIPLDEQPDPFVLGQDVDLRQRNCRIGGHRAEHAYEVVRQPLDRGLIEEAGAVLDQGRQVGVRPEEPHRELRGERPGTTLARHRHARRSTPRTEFLGHVLERAVRTRASRRHGVPDAE